MNNYTIIFIWKKEKKKKIEHNTKLLVADIARNTWQIFSI